MNDGQVFDVAALLSPIAGEAPTGIDMREDASPQSLYYKLKDARGNARAAERRADAEGGAGVLVPEWRIVLDLSRDVIAKQSKDLEIACWMLEALVRARGFAGLRDGLRLLRGLVETYWNGLHSLRDAEGVATFVAPLTGLNGAEGGGTLIQPIRKIPITAGGEQGSFAAYHYDQALALEQIADADARERRVSAGAPTLEQFDQALRSSPPDFLRQLLDDVAASLAELGLLEERLAERCGAEAPPLSAIRAAVRAADEIVRPRARELLPAEVPAEAATAAAPAGDGAAAPDAAAVPSGAISSREEALRLLVRVSAFFHATEPHSPIGFALDDLVRRGRMPLPELLAELLPDSEARRTLLTAAGIRPPREG